MLSLFGLLACFHSQAGIRAEPLSLIVTGDYVTINVLEQAGWIRDPAKQLQAGDVAAMAASDFQPAAGRFSRGTDQASYWLRFHIDADADARDQRWWLVAWPPFIDQLDLWYRDSDGAWQRQPGGAHTPLEKRGLPMQGAVFPVDLSGGKQQLLLHLKSNSTLTLSLQLQREDALIYRSNLTSTRHGILVGLFAMAIILALLCSIWMRQPFFYAATAYLICFGGFHIVINGYDQLLLYPRQPWLSDHAIGIFAASTAYFFIQLILTYLRPEQERPVMAGVVRALAWLALGFLALSFLGLYPHLVAAFQVFSLVVLLVLAALLIAMLAYRRSRALQMLLILLIPLFALLMQVLRNLGVLPASFWTTELWLLSAFVQVPFTAIVMLLHVRYLQQQSEMALVRERQQRDFLHMVAHEIRTPLTVLQTALANLRARLWHSQPDERPRLKRMDAALNRLNAVSANALSNDRLQPVTQALNTEPVRPSRLVDEALEMVVIDETRHAVERHLCDDDSPVSLDRQRCLLALVNLLDNAVKYSPEGGTIKVTVSRDSRRVRFSVSDPGMGICEGDLALIGKRFYRSEAARSMSGTSGLGLGLHLVNQVATAHNGSLEISSSPGEGTTATLTLPQRLQPDV